MYSTLALLAAGVACTSGDPSAFTASDATADLVPMTAAAASTTNDPFRVALADTMIAPGATTQATLLGGGLTNSARDRFIKPILTWRTANTAIATINSSGTVTAKAVGATMVEAVMGTTVVRRSLLVANGSTTGTPGDTTTTGGPNAPSDTTAPPPPPDTTTSTPPTPPPPPGKSPAELPRVFVTLPTSEGTGKVWRVRRGQKIQAAVDAAAYGDVILLEKGVTFTEGVKLRKKTGSGWITIRTDAPVTPAGVRVTLADSAKFARWENPGTNDAAIETEFGASGYWIVNVDITAKSGQSSLNTLVQLGWSSTQTSLTQVPTNIVLDRVLVRGTATLPLTRCVTLHAAYSAIVNSSLTECHGKGYDTQAIVGWNGPGPFLIENNLLEGAGENIMFGGADPAITGLNPSDIVIRGNLIRKPSEWKGRWTIKNLFELKQGKRVLFEDNVLENNWADAQAGRGVIIKSSNQSGKATWAEVSDISMIGNVFRDMPEAIQIAGFGSDRAVALSRVYFAENFIYRIGKDSPFPGRGTPIMLTGAPKSVVITRNTSLSNWGLLNIAPDGDPPIADAIEFSHNIGEYGTYGFFGDGSAGLPTLLHQYSQANAEGNCLYGSVSSNTKRGFPTSTRWTTLTRAVLFSGLDSDQPTYTSALNSTCGSAGAPNARIKDVIRKAVAGRP